MANVGQISAYHGHGSELSQAARLFAANSLRGGTRRVYASQLRQWIAWARAHAVADFPADPIHVANFIAERAAQGIGIPTLQCSVAAIGFAHHGKGLSFDSQVPIIGMTLRGISNAAPRLPRQVEPLRADDVRTIIGMLCGSPIDRRDAALLAVGYAFALRRSELVSLDLMRQGSGTGVLKVAAQAIEIALASSKTSAGKPEWVLVPRDRNEVVVRAIEEWLRVANVSAGEPIFRSVSKGGIVAKRRLDAQSVAFIVKRRVSAFYQRPPYNLSKPFADAEAARYGGHSLRVGLVVSAAESGADLRSIATITRHRSLDMPARYAQRADQLRTSPHNHDCVSLGSCLQADAS